MLNEPGDARAMPHFTIEYSANLDGVVDMSALCETVRKAAIETGIFPLGGIRVRMIRCADYAIADANPDNAFMDMVLRVGTGRDLETRQQAGETVFAAMEDHLADVIAARPFALSFEIREVHPDLNWKKNTIHGRLAAKAEGPAS